MKSLPLKKKGAARIGRAIALVSLLNAISLVAHADKKGESPAPSKVSQTAAEHPDQTLVPTTSAELAGKPAQSTTPLTLRECIDRALAKNLGLAVDKFGPQIAAQNIQIAQSDFDPTLTLSARQNTSVQSFLTSKSDSSRREMINTSLSISKKLDTGTNVSLSSSPNRVYQNNSSFYSSPTTYNADVSLSVSQPLLKGFGMAVNRASRASARAGLKEAKETFRGQVLDIILQTEQAYYNLAFARQQLKVRQTGLELAQKLLDENKVRQKTGVATSLDVLQAQVGVADQQSSLLDAEQTVKNAEDSLLALIAQFNFNQTIGTLELPQTQNAAPTFSRAYAEALKNQPEYKSTEASIQQLTENARLARNNRLPDLSVNGGIGYNGQDSQSIYNAYDQVPKRNSYDWALGISFSMPWGMRNGKAHYEQAKLNLDREKIHLRQLEQNMFVQIRSAVRDIKTGLERVKIAALATQLSIKEYQQEKAKFDAGLSTSRLVLDAQQRQDQSKVDELQARINLKQSFAQLRRLEGISIEHYGVNVPNE